MIGQLGKSEQANTERDSSRQTEKGIVQIRERETQQANAKVGRSEKDSAREREL